MNSSTIDTLKYASVRVIATVFLGAVLYIPLWHHNLFVLVVLSAIVGSRFVLNLRKEGFLKSFLNLASDVLLGFAAWSHNVPLFVITVLAVLIYAGINTAKKHRAKREAILYI